jgi:hypothetical protein
VRRGARLLHIRGSGALEAETELGGGQLALL